MLHRRACLFAGRCYEGKDPKAGGDGSFSLMRRISEEIFVKEVSKDQKQRISRIRSDCRRGK